MTLVITTLVILIFIVSISIVKKTIKDELKKEKIDIHTLYKYSIAELNNIRLFALLFVVLSVAFYFSSLEVKNEHAKKILEVLSSSFFTTGIFSILIGFSDFINFVTKRLTDIIIKNEFLNTLSHEKKVDLKKEIDIQVLGDRTTKDKSSLYTFLDNRLQDFFKSHYRTEFHDEYIYNECDKDNSKWIATNNTSYNLHKSKIDKSKIIINLCSRWTYKINPEIDDIIISFTIMVGGDKYEYKSVNTDRYFEPDTKNKILKEKIPVEIFFKTENNVNKFNFVSIIEIDNKIFEEKEHVLISMQKVQLADKSDEAIYMRLGYPTKDVYMSCHIISCSKYQIDCCSFGFEREAHVVKPGINSASVDIKEWLLAGHGAVISWVPFDRQRETV